MDATIGAGGVMSGAAVDAAGVLIAGAGAGAGAGATTTGGGVTSGAAASCANRGVEDMARTAAIAVMPGRSGFFAYLICSQPRDHAFGFAAIR